jgi:hypothetical protein
MHYLGRTLFDGVGKGEGNRLHGKELGVVSGQE